MRSREGLAQSLTKLDFHPTSMGKPLEGLKWEGLCVQKGDFVMESEL